MAPVWRTKDGREIPMPEMTDDHLDNAIQFMKKAIRELEELYDFVWVDEDSYDPAAFDQRRKYREMLAQLQTERQRRS